MKTYLVTHGVVNFPLKIVQNLFIHRLVIIAISRKVHLTQFFTQKLGIEKGHMRFLS